MLRTVADSRVVLGAEVVVCAVHECPTAARDQVQLRDAGFLAPLQGFLGRVALEVVCVAADGGDVGLAGSLISSQTEGRCSPRFGRPPTQHGSRAALTTSGLPVSKIFGTGSADTMLSQSHWS